MGDLGHWEGGDWVWDLSWRRPLFVWEMDLLADLLVVASRVSRVARVDVWFWTHSLVGHYSVKSAYSNLIKGLPASGIHEGVVFDVAYLRISKVSIYISSPQGLVRYHGSFDIDYHFKLKG